MVEVFRTNISTALDAERIRNCILNLYPDYKINFDLEDCDRVLRIETNRIISCREITELGLNLGLKIKTLEH
jgi:hypothetical protein